MNNRTKLSEFFIKPFFAVLTIIVCLTAVSFAQNSTSLRGTISDPNGSLIQGANITVRRGAEVFTTTTNDEGKFVFNNLSAGNYLLTVNASGFTVLTQEKAGGADDLQITLQVANATATVVVQAEVDSYLADTSTTGTKLDIPRLENPQSISVVTRRVFNDRNIIRLTETADSVSGIQPLTGYSGTQSNNYIFRGFSQNFNNTNLRNGFPEYSFLSQRDVVNIERIEFLKGPASLFYGAGEVGGVVNTITKKPQPDRSVEVGFATSTFGLVRPTIDATGAITSSKNLLYRVNFAYDQAGSYRDLVDNRNVFFAPSLIWKVTPKTTVSGEAELGYFRNDFDRGFVVDEIFLSEPVNKNFAEPFTFAKNKQFNLMLNLTHQFNENLGVRAGFNHIRSYTDTNVVGFGFIPLAADGRTINRNNFLTDEYSENYNSQNDFYARFKTGRIKHNFVAGVDYTTFQFKFTFDFRAIAPIDRVNPVYGALPTFYLFGFNDDSSARSYGFYVQDQIELSKYVKILLGGRGSFVDSVSRDFFTGDEKNSQNDKTFVPRAGIVITPTDTTSIHFSYANSFQPNFASRSQSGAAFKPTRGRQFEGGVKQTLINGRLFGTLAVYELQRRDVVVADPNSFLFSIQVGEQRSRGLELELNGQATRNWNFTANYSAIDAKVTKDADANLVGDNLVGIARHSGGIYSNYEFGGGMLRGFSFGVGLYAQSKSQPNLPNTSWFLPAFARIDTNFGYRRENWRVNVAIKNLNDKRYFETGGFNSIMPQASRNAVLSLSYIFR